MRNVQKSNDEPTAQGLVPLTSYSYPYIWISSLKIAYQILFYLKMLKLLVCTVLPNKVPFKAVVRTMTYTYNLCVLLPLPAEDSRLNYC